MEPGLVQGPPAIVQLDDKEMKYFSSSSRGIVWFAEKKAPVGIAYWMEILD